MEAGAHEQYVSVEEVMRRLSLSKNKTFDLLRRGEIDAVKIGKTVRVSNASLTAYLARNAYGKGEG